MTTYVQLRPPPRARAGTMPECLTHLIISTNFANLRITFQAMVNVSKPMC